MELILVEVAGAQDRSAHCDVRAAPSHSRHSDPDWCSCSSGATGFGARIAPLREGRCGSARRGAADQAGLANVLSSPPHTKRTYVHRKRTHTCWARHAFTICTHSSEHTYIHTYRNKYMHTYIHSFIHSYIHTFIHSYIHTYIHMCKQTNIHTYIHTYIHTCKHTNIHTCKHTNIQT